MGQMKSRLMSSLCGHDNVNKMGSEKNKSKSPQKNEKKSSFDGSVTLHNNNNNATANSDNNGRNNGNSNNMPAPTPNPQNPQQTTVYISNHGTQLIALSGLTTPPSPNQTALEEDKKGEGRGVGCEDRLSSGSNSARMVKIRQVKRLEEDADYDPGIIRMKSSGEEEKVRKKDDDSKAKCLKNHFMKHRVRFDMAKKQKAQGDQPQDNLPQPSSTFHLHTPQRRGSFLYRSNSDFELSPKNISRNSSVASDQHPEDVIITPFAQILNSLHNVHENFKALTSFYNNRLTTSAKLKKNISALTAPTTTFGLEESICTSPPTTTPTAPTTLKKTKSTATSGTTKTTIIATSPSPPHSPLSSPPGLEVSKNREGGGGRKKGDEKVDEEEEGSDNTEFTYMRLANETLSHLDWCLEQLEKVQTDKAVTEMARNKFKKLLSNEMTKCAESSKSGIQISEYICRTFLDQDVEMSNIKQVEVQMQPATTTSLQKQQIRQQQLKQQHLQHSKHLSKSLLQAQHSSKDHVITSIDEEDDNNNDDVIAAASSPFPSENDVITQNQKIKIDAILNEVDIWGIDVFRLAELNNNKPLATVTMHILKKRNLFTKLKISESAFATFMLVIEDHYRLDVPYHNAIHAADVTQSSHCLLSIPTLKSVFTDLEVFASIFASAVHDTDHPGVTNQYLINTGSDYALLYNDESVLENHHVSVAFSLLNKSNNNFLHNLSNKCRQHFRKMVISLVLATDMNKHMGHLAHLKTMAETRSISGENDLRLKNYAERNQVLQSLIHCADLSNPTKNLPLYRKWNDLISQEFYRQGDLEREQGLEISPMCDRTTTSVEKTQVGFIDYIVHPLWEAWADLVHPHCQHILDTLEDNREWYNNIVCSSPSTNPS